MTEHEQKMKDQSKLERLTKKKGRIYDLTNGLKDASESQKQAYNECQAECDRLIEKGANL
ncbi:MAG: hypothetical protein ABGW97_03030 [Christiangramia sp.]|uniref:hypothetical protein n=1 Tax=Christiangramia sp. TaxID=1931228 RepID=UPI0032422821